MGAVFIFPTPKRNRTKIVNLLRNMKWKDWLYKQTHWEAWHYHIKYIPILPAWAWHIARTGNFWFFTAANPALSFGGMDGERKKEMYDQFPKGTFPLSIYITPEDSVRDLNIKLNESGLSFPLAVKPDVGMGGLMFRKLKSKEELYNYHEVMDRDYIIQELVHYPVEVAIFYFRYPDSKQGTITGFIRKDNPTVTGDGVHTISQLIDKNESVRMLKDHMRTKHKDALDKILPPGEVYILADVHNRTQGGKMINLSHEIDEKLHRVMDEISNYTDQLFYGRFDIKCKSIEDLKEGRNFSILEFNGSGSGVQHVYGNGHTLFQACRIILKHWKAMADIAKINFSKGAKKWGFIEGLRFLLYAKSELKHLRNVENYYSSQEQQ